MRSVPTWVFLLCLLTGLLLMVAFGWVVRSNTMGIPRFGAVGEAAVEVATFPDTARRALKELKQQVDGSFKDHAIAVKRDPELDFSGLTPIVSADAALPGLMLRGDTGRALPGWRLLAGTFGLDGDVKNAALLLAPDLSVARVWVLEEIQVGDVPMKPRYRKFPHGIDITRDGSIVFTYDGSISLQKFNACGGRDWAIPGHYHHAVTLTEDQRHVWTFNDYQSLGKVRVADGEVVQEIPVFDIIDANPMIDILEMRMEHSTDHGVNSRDTEGRWMADPHHFNDVDPLPPSLVDRFPMFEEEDLLVSVRSLNLVFVLDPDDLKVKWWRAGATRRQHDPDWTEDGEILVFDNRMSMDDSRIVAFDPASMAVRTVLDGDGYDFYTRVRGKQQLMPDGSLAVTSPQQGRAFERAPDGTLALELINLKPGGTDQVYTLSELKWLPTDYFDKEAFTCPTPG
ncbi:arylsulfotransferase family protein [Rhodovulum sp. DZ06]|uniref:arylsulfotransferase family protein n=1 Tax=Rhodovulum sp. DZ06 TaxID=3425126 RepID=UPI003D32A9E0